MSIADITQRDYMPREELRALQLERLRATVGHAYAHVPFYHQALDERQITPTQLHGLEDLSKLPFTTREDLIEQYPTGLFAVPREQIARIHASSGTKGRSKIVGYTRRDIQTWAEVCARAMYCIGIRPGDILLNAYGYGLFTGGLGLHYAAETMDMTVIPTSAGNTQRQITFLRDLQATVLGCTPSYALVIGEMVERMQLSTSALSLRYAICGAEPWTNSLRQQIEQRLGLHAFDLYGLSEIIGPGVATECPAGRAEALQTGKRYLHVFEDHFLPEIVSPQGEPLPPGQEGELVLTTLTKEGMPLLRYRTGDLCTLETTPCACGRTLIRMSQVKGRIDDMLIIRGINVYPSEIERVLLAMPALAPYYQIVIERQQLLDDAAVEVEVAMPIQQQVGDLTSHDAGWAVHEQIQALQHKVGQALHEATGLRFAIHIHSKDTLPRHEGKAVRVIDRRQTLPY
jgi:phenylacetate-CoA ligase